jgi:Ser/Thr protein kinase RdoA (MazF antagonist)
MEGEPGLEEVAMTLRDVAGRGGHPLSAQKMKTGVYRLAVATPRQRLEVIAKRHTPPVAHRNRLVLERWLPAAGLAKIAPRLIGVAAQPAGGVVWHLYEDLGGSSLERSASTRPEVEATVQLIASLHAAFAGHSVLAECQRLGEDHGIAFYDQNVRDALSAVRVALGAADARSRDGDVTRTLLERLERLVDERDHRVGVLAEFGGPETLLHGDLWLSNVAVLEGARPEDGFGRRASPVRLIDWDHVGPGSFSYDLSTLILRFPADQRPRIVALYRAAAARTGIDVPADEYLQLLFTTAEYARIASDTAWRALLAAREGTQSAFAQLAEIDAWFERLQPRSELRGR